MSYSKNLDNVRKIARHLANGIDKAEQQLAKTPGINPAALKQLMDSKRSFIEGLLTTEPPPELKKFLEDNQE